MCHALLNWQQHHWHTVLVHWSHRISTFVDFPSLDWVIPQADQGHSNIDVILLPSTNVGYRFFIYPAGLLILLLLQRKTIALLLVTWPIGTGIQRTFCWYGRHSAILRSKLPVLGNSHLFQHSQAFQEAHMDKLPVHDFHCFNFAHWCSPVVPPE